MVTRRVSEVELDSMQSSLTQRVVKTGSYFVTIPYFKGEVLCKRDVEQAYAEITAVIVRNVSPDWINVLFVGIVFSSSNFSRHRCLKRPTAPAHEPTVNLASNAVSPNSLRRTHCVYWPKLIEMYSLPVRG